MPGEGPGPRKKQLAALLSPRVLLSPLLCFALWPLTFSCSGSRCKGVRGSYLYTPLPLHQFSTAIAPTWKSFLRSTLSLS